MKLICEQLNPHACKTYLVGLEGNREVILIDPLVQHVESYALMLERKEHKLAMVVETHTHADHISGAALLRDLLGCEYAMHAATPVQCTTMQLADESNLRLFGQVPVRILHSPGHTQDSICLVFPDRIFTGDALFLDDGGAGRDDLPGGDPGAHWETLRKLWDLPGELVVYPAHDYRDRQPSSLGKQKLTNPHLKMSRGSRDEFVQYLEDLRLGPADWMKEVLKVNMACTRDPNAAWIPTDSPACEVKGTMDTGADALPVSTILPEELRRKLASSSPMLLLDVREQEELNGPLGQLAGIKNIPIEQLGTRLAELEVYRSREIVTVCRSGGRAHTAAQILGAAGFANVAVLEGGMIAWNEFPDTDIGVRP